MSNWVIIIALIVGFSSFLNGQVESCDCQKDFSFLHEKIKKLPSYKRNKVNYESVYNSLLSESSQVSSYFECYVLLNKLLIPLNDWHMGIVEPAPDSLTQSKVDILSFADDLDGLRASLREKSRHEVEGVYFAGKNLSLGIVKDPADNVYHGVILESSSDIYHDGDIIYRLIPLHDNFYKVVGVQYPGRRMISYHERIQEGMFMRSGFRKDTVSQYYHKAKYADELLVFEPVTEDIDYLKVGSFASRYPYLKEAEDFYASLEGRLNKDHLILDLRNNGGGGDRNSDILLKQLKKYLKNNSIHILTNASTGSNAEQFTVKLKDYDNVTSYGDLTRASLSYEIKPNDYFQLPVTGATVVLPSKLHKKFLKYETYGVTPDHFLDYNRSWIEQVQEFISRSE